MFCINIPENLWQDDLHSGRKTSFGLENALAQSASPSPQGEIYLPFLNCSGNNESKWIHFMNELKRFPHT